MLENIEIYWYWISGITTLLSIGIEGYLLSLFIRPFLKSNCPVRIAGLAGGAYFLAMAVLYVMPKEISYANEASIIAALGILCLMERERIEQKLFLMVTAYLLQWIAHGIAVMPRSLLFAYALNTPYMLVRPLQQFALYVLVEVIYCAIRFLLLYGMIGMIHKVYVCKQENVTKKELLFISTILLTVVTGQLAFSFFANSYEKDLGQYIWNVHEEYTWIKLLYQLISFLAVFITIVIYQALKENQQKEKENLVLEKQIESMKSHIKEVERLYQDMRGLKHDMGNHITILERLYAANEKAEAVQYIGKLRQKFLETSGEIKTGNPVTDVILNEKKKTAEENQIHFTSDFIYPKDTGVDVFDVSVLLSNALENALEAAKQCEQPYIVLTAYRKKNIYMIEIENSLRAPLKMDTDTGLIATTKKDKEGHGMGLLNIRKVARKYYGEIDIEQTAHTFRLSIMLLLSASNGLTTK